MVLSQDSLILDTTLGVAPFTCVPECSLFSNPMEATENQASFYLHNLLDFLS